MKYPTCRFLPILSILALLMSGMVSSCMHYAERIAPGQDSAGGENIPADRDLGDGADGEQLGTLVCAACAKLGLKAKTGRTTTKATPSDGKKRVCIHCGNLLPLHNSDPDHANKKSAKTSTQTETQTDTTTGTKKESCTATPCSTAAPCSTAPSPEASEEPVP